MPAPRPGPSLELGDARSPTGPRPGAGEYHRRVPPDASPAAANPASPATVEGLPAAGGLAAAGDPIADKGPTGESLAADGDSASGRRRITEALDLDVAARRWVCNRCGRDLGPADRSYKEGCLLCDRDPREIHVPFDPPTEFGFSPHPDWCRIVEVYCPGCAVMFDVEYLPPGHPVTHDIEIDLDAIG